MQEFSRCPSCGCAVDDDLNGHHSAADCSILKYALRHEATARAEALREAADRLREAMRNMGLEEYLLACEFGELLQAILADNQEPQWADHDKYVYDDAKPADKQEEI